jgi:hypothetical protein
MRRTRSCKLRNVLQGKQLAAATREKIMEKLTRPCER